MENAMTSTQNQHHVRENSALEVYVVRIGRKRNSHFRECRERKRKERKSKSEEIRTWSSREVCIFLVSPKYSHFITHFSAAVQNIYIIYFQASTSWSRLIYLATSSWFSPWSVMCMDIRSSRCKPRNASIISQGETGLNHDVWEERCVLMNHYSDKVTRLLQIYSACSLCIKTVRKNTPLDPWTIGLLFGPFLLDHFLDPSFGPISFKLFFGTILLRRRWDVVLLVLREGWEADFSLREGWKANY